MKTVGLCSSARFLVMLACFVLMFWMRFCSFVLYLSSLFQIWSCSFTWMWHNLLFAVAWIFCVHIHQQRGKKSFLLMKRLNWCLCLISSLYPSLSQKTRSVWYALFFCFSFNILLNVSECNFFVKMLALNSENPRTP